MDELLNARNEIAARIVTSIKADKWIARAHAELSFTHFQDAFLGHGTDPSRSRELARGCAEKGCEIDELDPFVNLTIRQVRQFLRPDAGYTQNDFFRSFQFQDGKTVSTIKRAFEQLGIQ